MGEGQPVLGVPRETDSLCPVCVHEARQAILDGQADRSMLVTEKVGEIKAQIVERDGRILMVKDCPVHGHFEDVMAIDPEFFRHLERVFPGSDIRAHNDEALHNHGSSTIKYGRGSVLTVDLTNRCNMMCDPCFMDANQVGFVHELGWDEIRQVLDNAISIKPKRQMSVQYSAASRPCRRTSSRRSATRRKSATTASRRRPTASASRRAPSSAGRRRRPGCASSTCSSTASATSPNSHRHVGNLFDVKLKAIDNLHAAGVDIVLVTTIVNGVNNEQVGRIVEFAIDNPKKVSFLSFQPVSFTGRDELVSEERRMAQRYTLSHLAHDLKRQTGIGEPSRDWFPISFMGTFGDWADLVHGPAADWGHLNCGCHPNCGVGMAVMIDKDTKERAPVSAFLNGERLANDVKLVNDAARGPFLSVLGMALSVMRNYEPFNAPSRFRIADLLQKFDKAFGATRRDYGRVGKGRTIADVERRRSDRWLFLFVAGMWFQDLFNYDFRRTERCIIPYGTQEGEISFCAYNTGVGWRQIIEKMHMTATLTKWYEEHGRHEIFAGNRNVPLASTAHSLTLDPDAVAAAAQDDLVKAGIARTAREEKLMARGRTKAAGPSGLPGERAGAAGTKAAVEDAAYHARMAALYRQHVLKEQPAADVLRIQRLEPQACGAGRDSFRTESVPAGDSRQ